MKILLIGERYSENLGDAVICETVKRLIEQKCDAEIIEFDLSGRSGFNEYYSLRSLSRNRCSGYKKIIISTVLRKVLYRKAVDIKRCLRVMLNLNEHLLRNNFDIILFAGGALFQDYFAELIYSIVRQCKRKSPTVVFHACGLGKISDHSKIILKRVFNLECVKDISIRDSYERFIFLFGNEHKVTNTYDTALCCPRFYNRSNVIVAEYGIGCINWENTYHIQKQIIQGIMNSGATWKLFTNGDISDERVVDKLLIELGISYRKSELVLPRAIDAESLIFNITSFKKIISFRLHSHIIAASFGIPSYGFVWDSKVRDFFVKLGIPEQCRDITEKIDYETFVKDVKDNLDDIQREIKKQADLSKEDLYRQLIKEKH